MIDLTNNPHDKLFKEVFSNKKEAIAFLKDSIPKTVSSKIDWNSLKLQKNNFIDEDMKGSESDLLYEVKLDKTQKISYIYVLFEHQSNPDKWMGFRTLKYMCRIWDRQFKEHPRSKYLRPILPVVLYQGKKQWNISTKFTEQFGQIDIDTKFFPNFEYCLIDQTDLDDEHLNGLILGKVLQILMHCAHHGDFARMEHKIIDFLSKLPPRPGLEIRIMFMNYIAQTQKRKTVENFIKEIKTHKEMEVDMLTAAQV
ncbi:MAG: Rpn family recombination-promoting nuclease/putative transposase, partial [Verrucomicrobiota bacterium]|nr:Rpn family recombination-promoting nuclease/putative transposase [Verrucomicrobiota bacterium]